MEGATEEEAMAEEVMAEEEAMAGDLISLMQNYSKSISLYHAWSKVAHNLLLFCDYNVKWISSNKMSFSCSFILKTHMPIIADKNYREV